MEVAFLSTNRRATCFACDLGGTRLPQMGAGGWPRFPTFFSFQTSEGAPGPSLLGTGDGGGGCPGSPELKSPDGWLRSQEVNSGNLRTDGTFPIISEEVGRVPVIDPHSLPSSNENTLCPVHRSFIAMSGRKAAPPKITPPTIPSPASPSPASR